MNKPSTKKLSALGLVEVLVVLAIVGLTMVGSMQLTTGAFRSIRENEITDMANGIMVQSLEIIKSPQPILILDELGTELRANFGGSFAIDLLSSPPSLKRVGSVSSQPELITSCAPESSFFATRVLEQQQQQDGREGLAIPDVCLQVTLQPISGNPDALQVTSRVVYNSRQGTTVNTLYGFRSAAFGN